MGHDTLSRYYGCGTPLPSGISGLRVLDLGSGTGRDCYVAARMVGEKGFVTGKLAASCVGVIFWRNGCSAQLLLPNCC